MSGHLTITDVTRRFGRMTALDGVTLDVAPGRSLVLLGESGSGKSTLLRIVAGLEDADAGRVQLDDRVLSDPRALVSPDQRDIGMVFQSLELWPHMTAAEHLAFGMPGRPRGRRALADARVVELAFDVGLDASHLARRPDTLSGGERQRVAIARTLAAEPAVVLYDEPLASLDPSRRSVMRSLIRRLSAERNTTTVHVTHDAEEALAMGDEIAVLSNGHVVERGTPDSLYAAPTTLVGARALGPVTALPLQVDGTAAVTALGTAVLPAAADAVLARGNALAVWRPEHVRVVGETDGVRGVVTECRSTGPAYVVTAAVDGHTVFAHAADAVPAGTALSFSAVRPPVILSQPVVADEEAA